MTDGDHSGMATYFEGDDDAACHFMYNENRVCYDIVSPMNKG
jgi:hypothetical protein